MDSDAGEALLRAWLKLTATLWSRDMVTGLTFNEAVVCGHIYHQQNIRFTAAALCRQTNIQKSQMNQLLTSLERKGYLTRSRDPADRRQLLLSLTPEGQGAYLASGTQNREILSAVVAAIGPEQAWQTTAVIYQANAAVQAYLSARRQKGEL